MPNCFASQDPKCTVRSLASAGSTFLYVSSSSSLRGPSPLAGPPAAAAIRGWLSCHRRRPMGPPLRRTSTTAVARFSNPREGRWSEAVDEFDRLVGSEFIEWIGARSSSGQRFGQGFEDFWALSSPIPPIPWEKAMVVNLEFIKAIVTAEEVLLLDPLCQEVIPFVEQLRQQLPYKSQPKLHDPAEPSESLQQHELPFEFQFLEIALEVVCTYWNQVWQTLRELDGTRNKILSVREYIDDTEDYVNIQLDNQRNELIQLQLTLILASFAIAVNTLISGAFGMNIPCQLYETEGIFWTFVWSTSAACMLLFLLILGYARWKMLIN
ncbi:Magnesium transporter MRS2-4 [Senna tora]|uniref:Magnesium transporter MRS2-4 n=1 Tax=Senna tora TaxID=362788 RepID=A0A834XED4_9FABA|nr:Magnesium transporter MRS2-4 [Senna tora]